MPITKNTPLKICFDLFQVLILFDTLHWDRHTHDVYFDGKAIMKNNLGVKYNFKRMKQRRIIYLILSITSALNVFKMNVEKPMYPFFLSLGMP